MGLYNVVNGVPNHINGVIQRGKRGSKRGKWGSERDKRVPRWLGYIPQRIGRIYNPTPQRQENNYVEITTFHAIKVLIVNSLF